MHAWIQTGLILATVTSQECMAEYAAEIHARRMALVQTNRHNIVVPMGFMAVQQMEPAAVFCARGQLINIQIQNAAPWHRGHLLRVPTASKPTVIYRTVLITPKKAACRVAVLTARQPKTKPSNYGRFCLFKTLYSIFEI